MKTKEIVKAFERDGWFLVLQKGSHKQCKHPDIRELITIPDHGGNKELSIGVLNDIKKKAGWK